MGSSRRIALKVYNKWRGLKQHPLSPRLPFHEELERYAEPLLRIEVRLLSQELRRRGLNRAAAWVRPGITEQLIQERIATLKMNQKLRLTEREIQDLPPRLIAIYKLWKQGEDLRALYPKTTYYRYYNDLLRHGIDISVPQPNKAEVIPLVRYLTAEHVAQVPDWTIGTDICLM